MDPAAWPRRRDRTGTPRPPSATPLTRLAGGRPVLSSRLERPLPGLAVRPGRATRRARPLLCGARGGMERDSRPRRAAGAGIGAVRGGPAARDRRTGAGPAGATGIALVLAERRARPPHGALRRGFR